tara:strand:- start:25385 stop:26239 length:855 start_codon:yes stop_codon:yes gene_type:complete
MSAAVAMKTAHLFAGVGGGMLADLILGHTPVLAVEQDAYCCDVLRDRSEDGWFPGLTVAECDIRTFDFMPWRGRVDCIAAGFPCQDISAAGKGAGIGGERSGLFFEVTRAIDVIQPRYVFLENSPLIRTRGRDVVIRELLARGYAWRDGKIGASDVGAPHRRDRWFLLAANPDRVRRQQEQHQHKEQSRDGGLLPNGPSGTAPDTLRTRLQEPVQRGALEAEERDTIEAIARHTGAYDWAPAYSHGGGMAHGLSAKSHRVRALGNAQVPLQAAAAWLALMSDRH